MTVNFKSDCYEKERSIIRLSEIEVGSVVLMDATTTSIGQVVEYKPSADGTLAIDITDLVRVDVDIDVELIERFADNTEESAGIFSFYISGSTDPAKWLVPLHQNAAEWNDVKRRPLPNRILQSIYGISNVFPATKLADTPSDYRLLVAIGSVFDVQTDNDITVSGQAAFVIQEQSGGRWVTKMRQEVAPQECDKRYAAVQWIDRSGHIKRATWELRRVVENAKGEVALENLTNAYDVRKGSEITAVLHLDGLTAYDVWYYADIVTSSDVRLALNGGAYDRDEETIFEENKIEVTTDKVEIPDGDSGKFYSLDIEINYKRYDTV